MHFALGTAEHVSMIDKYSIQCAVKTLTEDRLAIVAVTGTDIQQPAEPEVVGIPNPSVEVSRKEFVQDDVLAAHKLRPKAETRFGAERSFWSFNPTGWICVDKETGNHQWPPGRDRKFR